MTICWHGTRLYAFYSRDVGKFGGRAKHATIKIYDGNNAASPLATISGEMVKTVRKYLESEDASCEDINDYLRGLLPSNDPYRIE